MPDLVLNIAVPVLSAADGEPSKVPFYVVGGLLVTWAVLVSALGLRAPDFPGSPGRTRLVMLISAVLVLGAVSTAVATSGKPAKAGAQTGAAAVQAGQPKAGGVSTALPLAADPGGQLKYDATSLKAKAGKVTIDFTNRSAIGHNVTLEAAGHTIAATPTITGSTAPLSAALKPGTYTFYCSVPGHRQAGMQGTLTVG